MYISTIYPNKASKLYHKKAGQVIQIACNDGSVDSNMYMVTNKHTDTTTTVINLANGKLEEKSVSVRTIQFPDAVMHPIPREED